MLLVVVTVNLLIAGFNFYLAVKIWQLRKLLVLITSAFVSCENYFGTVLLITPQVLLQEQANIYHFRQRYQLWQIQLQKIRQMIVLVSWLYRLGRKYRLTWTC